ncbi:MAG: glycosyltransferase, partial [Bacteroidota bacterium]
MHVTIVIPCYNEAETVPRLIDALDAAEATLRSERRQVEVILVDDGSRDGSFEMLRTAAASRSWMRLIRFRRNFGQTAAMAAGFRAARGDVIIPMDAD